MNLSNSIKVCLSKYADFNGRASRSEYRWFTLFSLLIEAAGRAVNNTIYGIVAIALLLPQLFVTARRLHNLNKSA